MGFCDLIVNYVHNLNSDWKHALLEGHQNDFFVTLLREDEEDCNLVFFYESQVNRVMLVKS